MTTNVTVKTTATTKTPMVMMNAATMKGNMEDDLEELLKWLVLKHVDGVAVI